MYRCLLRPPNHIKLSKEWNGVRDSCKITPWVNDVVTTHSNIAYARFSWLKLFPRRERVKSSSWGFTCQSYTLDMMCAEGYGLRDHLRIINTCRNLARVGSLVQSEGERAVWQFGFSPLEPAPLGSATHLSHWATAAGPFEKTARIKKCLQKQICDGFNSSLYNTVEIKSTMLRNTAPTVGYRKLSALSSSLSLIYFQLTFWCTGHRRLMFTAVTQLISTSIDQLLLQGCTKCSKSTYCGKKFLCVQYR